MNILKQDLGQKEWIGCPIDLVKHFGWNKEDILNVTEGEKAYFL